MTTGKPTMGETVRIEGLKGTVRRLKAFDVELPREVKTAGLEAAELVRARAVEFAPVGKAEDRDQHPGALRATVRTSATATKAVVKVGNKARPYAGPIIFGWRAHNVSANAFIFRALDEERTAVLAEYEATIARLVHQVEGAE